MIEACFARHWRKASKTLIADNVGKGYGCFCGLFFDFEKALASFSLNSSSILKFTYADNVAENLWPA